ncbi:fungal-specific transcription factor domain-containing protein [Flagelloscypha sp. PMI_526]|nr:fungal-specific transcription factor domain-containing protein [Flagelloscypha sp. PMI_526]
MCLWRVAAPPAEGERPPQYIPTTERPSTFEKGDIGGALSHGDCLQETRDHGARFFGQSSNLLLLREAYDQMRLDWRKPSTGFTEKRPRYWTIPSWDKLLKNDLIIHPIFQFPCEDLMQSLLDLFFKDIAIYWPMIHEPTFRKSVADRLHEKDTWFGGLLLVICALASRLSDDPRCLAEPGEPLSAGAHWFCQVKLMRSGSTEPTNLFELQTYCLASIYLQETSNLDMIWPMIGQAVRLAYDVGVHRSRGCSSLSIEQWRRTFWALVVIDTLVSAVSGRPRATHPSDYDLDVVAEVDDEYWVNADTATKMKQPPDTPAKATCFAQMIKLMDILGFAQRTLYAVRKPGINSKGDGESWARDIITEVDNALAKWRDELPDHLRWNPSQSNYLFFSQSTMLHSTLCVVQIQIHRPFIPLKAQVSALTYPAFTACINSSRFVCTVAEAQTKRGVPNVLFTTTVAVMYAGVMMALALKIGKRLKLNVDVDASIRDIKRALEVMKYYEPRSRQTGRLYDMLNEMMSSDEQFMSSSAPLPNGRKRVAASDDDDGSPSTVSTDATLTEDTLAHSAHDQSSSSAPTTIPGFSHSPVVHPLDLDDPLAFATFPWDNPPVPHLPQEAEFTAAFQSIPTDDHWSLFHNQTHGGSLVGVGMDMESSGMTNSSGNAFQPMTSQRPLLDWTGPWFSGLN